MTVIHDQVQMIGVQLDLSGTIWFMKLPFIIEKVKLAVFALGGDNASGAR